MLHGIMFILQIKLAVVRKVGNFSRNLRSVTFGVFKHSEHLMLFGCHYAMIAGSYMDFSIQFTIRSNSHYQRKSVPPPSNLATWFSEFRTIFNFSLMDPRKYR